MPKISSEITPRIAELLAAGVISITTNWYNSGSETYGRVTQPHPKLGVYPHESYILEELEPLLEKVRIPSGYVPPAGGSPRATPSKAGNAIKVSCRTVSQIGKVPDGITINGVHNSLPKGSLTWGDLQYLGDDQLNRRILSLGREIGADKAVSRITSGPELYTTRAETLHKWWKEASTYQRFTLLTVAKKVGKVPEGVRKSELLARLGVGQYPFRGTDRKIQENEEEYQEVSEEETEGSEDLGISLGDLSI
jgi:hypothetical protein